MYSMPVINHQTYGNTALCFLNLSKSSTRRVCLVMMLIQYVGRERWSAVSSTASWCYWIVQQTTLTQKINIA